MSILLNLGRKILIRQQNSKICSTARNLSARKMENIISAAASESVHPDDCEVGTRPRIRSNPAVKKINSPEFRGIFTNELRTLLGIFKEYNYEVRIAGGAVRDILMNMHPKDIDLATTATPEEMKAMFTKEDIRMINAKGEKHGTITVRIFAKENFEITTLRIDVVTDGRHAEVQFTTNWQLDANRRDLTINSMFLGFDGTLYDYFYGYEDLENRRVAFVGNADTRIKEDFLRILRYFRFYGRVARQPDNHDAKTLHAIKVNIQGLQRISGERIWAELHKILTGNYNLELVHKMLECGIAKYVGLPDEPNLAEFTKFHERIQVFKDKPPAIVYLIALLYTKEDAMRLHERLKLSAFERDMALFITQHRDKVEKDYSTLLDYQRLCMHPFAKREYVEELLRYSGKLDLYESLKSWKVPQFPLNGVTLKALGFPEGKGMGKVLSDLRAIWADSGFSLTKDELVDKHLAAVIQNIRSSSTEKPPRKKSKTSRRESEEHSSGG